MKTPTFNEWKENNQGKTINDYYIEYPESRKKNNENNYYISPPIESTKNLKKEKAFDILLIISSILIIIAFFLPWVNVSFFKLGLGVIYGQDLPNFIQNIYSELPESIVNTIYLIPIGAFLVVIGETTKIWALKAFFEMAVVMVFFYWFYMTYYSFSQKVSLLGIEIGLNSYFQMGILLTLAGVIYYIVSILKSFAN